MLTLSWITLVILKKVAKNTSRTSLDYVKEQKHIMPHNALQVYMYMFYISCTEYINHELYHVYLHVLNLRRH